MKLISGLLSVLSLTCSLAMFYYGESKIEYTVSILNFYAAIINYIDYSKKKD